MINKLLLRLKSDKVIAKSIFILLLMQPILDIFSFFVVGTNLNIVTTLFRMFIFGIVTLYAFLISDNRQPYFIMAAVLGVFFAFHMIACISEGYISLYEDVTMYIRTIQVPVYTLVFITFFRKIKNFKELVGKAFWFNYVIISASILLSFAVGRPEFTYRSGYGIKGWFFTGNAQSCILSIMAPLGLCYAYRKKNSWLFFMTLILEFGNLFIFGTRVAYYAIFIVGFSFIVFLLWNKEKRWIVYLLTITTLMICALGYRKSPCYMQQYAANASYGEEEAKIQALLPETDGIKTENKENRPHDEDKNGREEKGDKDLNSQDAVEQYREIYSLYLSKLIERFGLGRVVKKYKYSVSSSDLINNRELKVNYSSLVMDEKNLLTHLFGFEYMDYIYDGEVYEPENDFPGIFFSCGYVGLGMYIVFILYFAFVAIKGIILDKCKIPLEKGMVGVALILMLVIAQLSGNVLRRPNVSIYLSVMLAYLFLISISKKNSGGK